MSAADWTEGGAEFDVAYQDGVKPLYRHHLWRARPADLIGKHLISKGRRLGVIMHNPSIAGAHPTRDNDPTIRKVIGFAERWGFGRIDVANLGDLIATDPGDFYDSIEAGIPGASAKCDERIREVASAADTVLVAWGALTKWWSLDRAAHVLQLIGRPVVCIAVTKHGHPQHPSRAPYTDAPIPYEERRL